MSPYVGIPLMVGSIMFLIWFLRTINGKERKRKKKKKVK